jgi:hypothetical protein
VETRTVIERAMGLPMSKQNFTQPGAFRWVQRTATDRRTTMKAIAKAVMEISADIPPGHRCRPFATISVTVRITRDLRRFQMDLRFPVRVNVRWRPSRCGHRGQYRHDVDTER